MKKIVVIGGGTGSFTVLTGLKEIQNISITAVVTAFDSGGSSGVLKDQIGVLPAGDARRCIVALAEDQGSMRKLFNFRFENGVGDHSVGNIIIAALEKMLDGDGFRAIQEAGKILRIKGRVMPVSIDKADLCARLSDGTEIKGEANIDKRKVQTSATISEVFLAPEATIHPEVARAILEADVIVFAPGDLFTSLVPNFLVNGMREALMGSKARFVYSPNLMTKKGETDGFKVSDFVKVVLRYSGLKKLDLIVCNKTGVDAEALSRYASESAQPVELDLKEIEPLTRDVLVTSLLENGSVVRHNPAVLARIISGV